MKVEKLKIVRFASKGKDSFYDAYYGKSYSAIIRARYHANHTTYQLTIMNGELEKSFYGKNILIENKGTIQLMKATTNPEVVNLGNAISASLQNYLKQLV